MSRSYDFILTLMLVAITIIGWVNNQKAQGRERRKLHPPSPPPPRTPKKFNELAIQISPPTNWPKWAVSTVEVLNDNQDTELHEGASVEQPLQNNPLPDSGIAITTAMSEEGEDEKITTELIRGIIWSEVLQPPVALRRSRR